MKKKDLYKKSEEDLEKLFLEKKKELMVLKSSAIGGEDENKKKGRLKTTKKTIARIKTKLNNL